MKVTKAKSKRTEKATPTGPSQVLQNTPIVWKLPIYKGDNSLDDIVGIKPKADGVIRRSEITSWESCPRMALLNYTYGIRPVARNRGRDQSSYAHITVALLLRGMPAVDVAEVIDKIMQEVAADSPRPDDPELAKDASMGYAVGCYIHDQLVDFVQARGYEILNIEHKIEDRLRIQHPDLGLLDTPFRFQTDFVIRDPKSGRVMLWDTKAIATSTAKYAAGLRLALQTALYVAWAQQTISPKVTTLLYGLCQKPQCSRKGLTRGEEQSLEDYVLETYENLEGYGRGSKLADKRVAELAMQIIPVTPKRVQIETAMIRVANHLSRVPLGRNHYNYPGHDSCTFGNSTCSYLPICGLDDKLWESEIKEGTRFTTRPDPLDSDRINGATLKPVKVPTVRATKIHGIPTMVDAKVRGKITNRWKKFKL